MSSPTSKTEKFLPLQELKGHTDSVTGIIHLPGGRRTITSSRDGSLRLWNMKSGLQIGQDWRDGDSPVFDIALSPDGKRVVSGGMDGSVRLWDIHTKKMIAKWIGHTDAVNAVCWSEDGRRVVSVYSRGTVIEWDVESGENILEPLQIVDGMTYAFAYSPKKAMIAIATIGKDMRYSEETWDFKTRKLVTLNGKRRTGFCVNCLVWTADGEKLIGGTLDLVIIWSCEWEEIASFKVGQGPLPHTNSMAVSPSGQFLAIAYGRGAYLLNLENGQPIVGQSQKPVDCVSFSTDGKLQSFGFTARHTNKDSKSKPTECGDFEDYIIETYDIEAILKKIGLGHLLLDAPKGDDKPLLDGDATRAAVHQPENVRRLYRDFFDDTRDGTRSSPSHLPLRSPTSDGLARSTRSAPHKWRFRLLSHSEHTARERQTLSWTRALFSGQLFRRDQPYGGRRPAVVETPYTRGLDRNVKVNRESEQKASNSGNIVTITVPGPSRPQNSGTDQQSSDDVPGQNPSLPSQLAVNTTPATAAVIPSGSESAPAPDTMMTRQAGCLTRFWLSLGCISAEDRH